MTSLPDRAQAGPARTRHAGGSKRAGRPSGRAAILALLAITGIGIALRIHYLGQPMRWDETFSFLTYSFRPLGEGLSTYTPNNHLLHTLLVNISSRVAGAHPEVLRLPALLAGAALTPAAFFATRRLWDTPSALVAAAFVSASSLLVEFSVDARGYTLLALSTLVAIVLGDRFLERRNIGRCVAFAAAGAVGFATVPLMILPFGGIVIWLLAATIRLPNGERRSAAGWLTFGSSLAVAGGALMYVPAAIRHGVDPILTNEWVAPRTWSGFIHAFPPSAAETWSRWARDVPLFVSIAFAAGFAVSLAVHWRASKGPVPIGLTVALWSLAIVATRRVVPYPRNWIFALPIFLAGAAAGIAWVAGRCIGRPRWHRAAPAVAVVISASLAVGVLRAGSVPASSETGRFRAGPSIASALAPTITTRDRVLSTGAANKILEFYFRINHMPTYLLHGRLQVPGRIFLVVDTGKSQTLEDQLSVLNRARVDLSDRAAPVLLGRFPDGELYQVGEPGSG